MARIFVYVQSIAEQPQPISTQALRDVDFLPAAPGGIVEVINTTLLIHPGQIVKMPAVMYANAALHRRSWLKEVPFEDYQRVMEESRTAQDKPADKRGFLGFGKAKKAETETGVD